jgi:hypothetical protein
MSDKIPTVAELVTITGLDKEDVEWVTTQLGIAGQTKGVITRQNPSPVAFIASNGSLAGVTVAGTYLIYATQTEVKYMPLGEAVLKFIHGSDTGGDRLVASIGNETIDVSLVPDQAVGVTLGRIHSWIRNMVIDYRRT